MGRNNLDTPCNVSSAPMNIFEYKSKYSSGRALNQHPRLNSLKLQAWTNVGHGQCIERIVLHFLPLCHTCDLSLSQLDMGLNYLLANPLNEWL